MLLKEHLPFTSPSKQKSRQLIQTKEYGKAFLLFIFMPHTIMRTFFIAFNLLIVSFCLAQSKQYYLFIGTYTNTKSEGVYVYKFNEEDGNATFISKAKTDNPSYLAISHNHKFMYVVKEGGADNTSAVSAYRFNSNNGELTFINRQPTKSNGPCYVAVNASRKWVFTANYKGGSLSAFSVKDDGSLDTVSQLIQHIGSSANKSRQQEPHVHTVVFSPDEKYLFTNDLGTDKINRYSFNPNAYPFPLSQGNDSVTKSASGNGPRHLAFSPNNKFMYVINELAGTIDVFAYSENSLKLLQTISTDSTNNSDKGSADIHLSPDGNFLYATNRGNYNSIATFRINNKSGKLQLINVQNTGGILPRNFCITPSGNWLLIGHQKSDYITLFKRNLKTGILTPTNQPIPISSAVCLKMIDID